MFTNHAGCTIFEKIKRGREPSYVRHTTGPCYIEQNHGQSSGSDRIPQNSDFISIPEASADYLPKPDDRIVYSIIDGDVPPADALTIMTVSDLRFGSPRVRHIELTAR